MTLEGAQRPRQGQPPEEGQKKKPRGMCRAALFDAVGRLAVG